MTLLQLAGSTSDPRWEGSSSSTSGSVRSSISRGIHGHDVLESVEDKKTQHLVLVQNKVQLVKNICSM